MTITLFIEYIGKAGGNVDINLVDNWYEENYWTTSSTALGQTTSGPFSYNKGHRKATLWDGAGTVMLEISDLDFPPCHITDRPIKGRIFQKVKNRLLSYGSHIWFHEANSDSE
jgi:hypothetical protein